MSLLHSILIGLFLCCLFIDAYIDFTKMELPNEIALIIALLGCLRFLTIPSERSSLLIGAFIVSLPLFILAIITHGFGGGDIKLCATCGFFLGWEKALLGALIGCFAGAAYTVILILIKKAGLKTTFPFGPFLCLGFSITVLLF